MNCGQIFLNFWNSGFGRSFGRSVVLWQALFKRLLDDYSFQLPSTLRQILERPFLLRNQTWRGHHRRLRHFRSEELCILLHEHLSGHRSLLRLLWLNINHQRRCAGIIHCRVHKSIQHLFSLEYGLLLLKLNISLLHQWFRTDLQKLWFSGNQICLLGKVRRSSLRCRRSHYFGMDVLRAQFLAIETMWASVDQRQLLASHGANALISWKSRLDTSIFWFHLQFLPYDVGTFLLRSFVLHRSILIKIFTDGLGGFVRIRPLWCFVNIIHWQLALRPSSTTVQLIIPAMDIRCTLCLLEETNGLPLVLSLRWYWYLHGV